MLNKSAEIYHKFCSKIKTLPRAEIIFGSVAVVILLFGIVFLFPDKNDAISAAKQEINELSNNIRNHYKTRPDYWGLSTENAVKNSIVPTQMVRGNKIMSTLGKEINVGQDKDGTMVMPGGKRFTISIANVGKSACRALLADNTSHAENPALVAISLNTGAEIYAFEWGGELSLPITPDQANKFCKNSNEISWILE